MSRYLFAAALAVLSFAASAQTAPAPYYIDVSGYPLTDAQYEAWINLRSSLKANFDEICGDTFCEGEFSNIESLRFSCSVDQATGRIGMCAWVFAASNEEVDPVTGRISIAQRDFWRCRTPLVAGTRIGQLIKALQGDRPLYAPLPNTTTTIMDGLIGCL